MKLGRLEKLARQLVAAENIVKSSKDSEQIRIAMEKIDEITKVCLEDDLNTLLELDAMAHTILDEEF